MNLKALGESLGLDEDEFIEIVEIFIDSALQDLKKLNDAFSSENYLAASEAAHSLKGSAANLGFMDIAGIASKLEKDAQKKNVSNIGDALPLLNHMLDQIRVLV